MESPSRVLDDRLVCPECRGGLELHEQGVRCTECAQRFPTTSDGTPVLLPANSAFDPESIAAGKDTYYEKRSTENVRKQKFRRRLPGLANDIQAHDADQLVNDLIAAMLAERPADRGATNQVAGIIIGAGFHMDEYGERFPGVNWLATDSEATFGATVVADVLGLPVADGSQDVVLCEHILEHVIDPPVAARELERVLKPGGIALIKVPFNYPWHGGYIDFFRFTPAGYLAAFRRCEPIHLGHGPGPASTIAYALQGAWLSLFRRRSFRLVAVAVGRLVFGPIRHLDRILIRRQGSLNTSCSLIYVGRRVEYERTPTEIVAAAKKLGAAPVVAPLDRESAR